MRILDLYCGAGGCSVGYHRAGFDVVGVDLHPQPRYPFERVQLDALDALRELIAGRGITRGGIYRLASFDAIHASPPCQAFSDLQHMHNALAHDDMLTPTRDLLIETGLPYVIENVEGAPMRDYVTICGSSLGLGLGLGAAQLRRHRRFETNWTLMVPPCQHGWATRVIGVYGGHGRDRRRVTNTQDFSVAQRREAMGIDWMNGAELSQAIPPAYTELIGHQLAQYIASAAA